MALPQNTITRALGIAALACVSLSAAALAQPPVQQAQATATRDDVLDSLVRRMALCAEIQQPARRAECYDRIQRTPESAGAQPPAAASPPQQYPTYVTGGATGEPHVEINYPHKECYENRINCAYDTAASRPSGGVLPAGSIREIGRTQGPEPARDGLLPLVTMRIIELHTVHERWLLTVAATSGARRTIDPEFTCTLTNAGQPVSEMTYTARGVRPGESVAVELTGPPVTASYVDGANCRVLGPITLK